jgi:hypothetical protein
MTHSWSDPSLPLSSAEQKVPVGAILPSSEAHFFDTRQDRKFNNGSGINFPFEQNFETTVIFTSGSSTGESNESGIFQYNKLDGPFSYTGNVPSGLGDRLKPFRRPPEGCPPVSNAANTREPTDFRVQDSVIYHKRYITTRPTEILFLSSYLCKTEYDRYGNFDSYYNAGFGG